MLIHEEIRDVYDQGPEAIIALVEHWCALIDQQQAQSAELGSDIHVMLRRSLSFQQVVMANEIFDRADVIGQLLGKG